MSAGFHLVAVLLLAHAPGLTAVEDRSPPFPDQQMQQEWKRAQELARKGVEELLRSLEVFKNSLPEYGRPYIDPDGNIIIPRKRRGPPNLETPVPEPSPERT
jgi:hypothetical protein